MGFIIVGYLVFGVFAAAFMRSRDLARLMKSIAELADSPSADQFDRQFTLWVLRSKLGV